MPLQGGHGRQQNLVGAQPARRPVKNHPGPVDPGPTQSVKPPVKTELNRGFAVFAKTAVIADFCRMVPSRFALPINEKAAELVDVKLPSEIGDDTGRNFREVIEKGPKKARRAELRSETQAAVVATVSIDNPQVSFIEIKITG